jgi:hypothetical protein
MQKKKKVARIVTPPLNLLSQTIGMSKQETEASVQVLLVWGPFFGRTPKATRKQPLPGDRGGRHFGVLGVAKEGQEKPRGDSRAKDGRSRDEVGKKRDRTTRPFHTPASDNRTRIK